MSRLLFGVSLRGSPPPKIYTLSLHDALPILFSSHSSLMALPYGRLTLIPSSRATTIGPVYAGRRTPVRSEEHTSELQSRFDLVCRLLLEKKKNSTAHRSPPKSILRRPST